MSLALPARNSDANGLRCRPDAVAAVATILALPDSQLDYARAKLAFDAIIDPSVDEGAVLSELDRLADEARRMAGSDAAEEGKLIALRTLIYESGPWNGHRPFEYDHADFKNLRVKLLSHYLRTRRGNCVSMPVLFLILANQLGLDVALAMAPVHFFLRHTGECGRIVNLEPTSGAMPARDVWIRQIRPMSDRAVESGLYMRSLTRREGVAAMALTVVEHLREGRRFEEAVQVAEIILQHNPRDGLALANQGQAYFGMCGRMLNKYRSAFLIPLSLRAEYMRLLQRNHAAFAAARALGWEPCT